MRAFADELARCGLVDVCTSPGSRSTPLVLALVRERRLRATSHLDERAGGFFAVGAAKASGRPAALACTSGTAAANYLPAVVEAFESATPLLVLTADRPPELRDVGAGQAIDQVKLYGRAAKWYLEVDDAPATPERLRWIRQLACRAFWTAVEGRPGPVHLNFAFREPLVAGGPLPAGEDGRPGGRPWLDRVVAPPPAAGALAPLLREIERRPRALVVAGRLASGGEDVAHFAARCRIPLLADPLSGARRGEAIAHYDALLRVPAWAREHAPELVIRAGDLPTSKPLREWLAGLAGTRQIALDPHLVLQDPTATVGLSVPVDPGTACRALERERVPQAPPGWLESWRDADDAAREAMGEVLGGERLSEPNVAAALGARLDGGATLVVASSMPVRDAETLLVTKHSPPRVLANRGANGIDGTVSTAFGVAAASAGPVVLLTGDVALAHDLGGLVAARRLGLRLVVVVVDNDGGGIFHFLPVAGETDAFEEHVATPHGLDFAHAAALYGLAFERPADLRGFHAALERALAAEGSTLILVRTERVANVELHRRMWDAVARSVRPGA